MSAPGQGTRRRRSPGLRNDWGSAGSPVSPTWVPGPESLTRQLAELRAHVVAVEPQEAMRVQFAAILSDVEVLDGVAESLPLESGSVDTITVGTAFHWFAAAPTLAEFARVLRPSGGVAIFLNYPDPAQPLGAALDEIAGISRSVQRRTIRFESQNEQGYFPTGAACFAESHRFGVFEERTFPFDHSLSRDQLVARYESFAFFAALPDEERAAEVGRIRQIATTVPEPITLPMVTHVTISDGSCRRDSGVARPSCHPRGWGWAPRNLRRLNEALGSGHSPGARPNGCYLTITQPYMLSTAKCG